MTTSTLQVLGAADTVTGSRYLITVGTKRVLVDCGLFQGYKVLRERNRTPFPVRPASIDAVLLTHAHLDHSGYLPALVRDGFSGPIHTTGGTAELCRLLLPDSGHLLEEEAESHRRHGSSRHAQPRPLYTFEDAMRSLGALRPHAFGKDVSIVDGITTRFVPAGHIVGAAQLQIEAGGTRLHFTGDLGRTDDEIMRPPVDLEAADMLITESTYGNRHHPDSRPEDELGEVVRRVVARSGVVIIPAFAVGRAETLILHLSRLLRRGEIPDVPIYLNSPMAVNAAEIYQSHLDELRITASDLVHMNGMVHLVRTVDESKWLNRQPGPMVIISASGMITGGRVLHHIAEYGPGERNAVVLSGFQAGGTRGAALAAGERTLRIFGRDIPIAAEVVQLVSMSAHADADGLMRWMRTAPVAPKLTWVTHGEAEAADALRIRIQRDLGWEVRVPSPSDSVDLGAL
ncbi:MAG: MBL fold metallo-hydrolase [Acidobacteria bacterium]|nr:MBL fold metallo-hydrolase [Acidobacteriota bacterium]